MITTSSGTKYYTQEEMDAKENAFILLNKIIEEFKQDASIISTRLCEEAEERSWCSEYNDWIDSINEHLTRIQLHGIAREYNIDVVVTRTQSQTITVSITADDASDAKDEFESNYDSYIEDNTAVNDWETIDLDYEIESAYEA